MKSIDTMALAVLAEWRKLMKPKFAPEQLAYLKAAVDCLQKELGNREIEATDNDNVQRAVAFQDAQLMVREVFDGLYK